MRRMGGRSEVGGFCAFGEGFWCGGGSVTLLVQSGSWPSSIAIEVRAHYYRAINSWTLSVLPTIHALSCMLNANRRTFHGYPSFQERHFQHFLPSHLNSVDLA